MNPIYQAQHYDPKDYRNTYKSEDFENEADAIAAVEKAGGGTVVKFARYRNLPHCLPEIRCSSIWMKSYSDGKWKDHTIHTI